MNITSIEDQGTYTNYVNPIWVKLLDTAGMNVRYTHCSGSELYTADGRTILDCLSGYCVHNVGHNHPFVVAELVSELQSQTPAMLQSNVVKEAGALARTLCENAGGKVAKVFFLQFGQRGSRGCHQIRSRAYWKNGSGLCGRRIPRIDLRGAFPYGKRLLARELRADVRRNPRGSVRRSGGHRKAAPDQNRRGCDPRAYSS